MFAIKLFSLRCCLLLMRLLPLLLLLLMKTCIIIVGKNGVEAKARRWKANSSSICASHSRRIQIKIKNRCTESFLYFFCCSQFGCRLLKVMKTREIKWKFYFTSQLNKWTLPAAASETMRRFSSAIYGTLSAAEHEILMLFE